MAAPALAPTPRRRAGLILPALGLVALTLLAGWTWRGYLVLPAPARTVSADAVELQSRRIEVVLSDVQKTWARLTVAEGLRRYVPVEHRFFVRATLSPCAGRDGATGPFYCPDDRILAFDLRFFASLSDYLLKIEDKGGKLVIAQQSAAALQDQLGILGRVAKQAKTAGSQQRQAMDLAVALQADCLTGVWAATAADRLGAITPGLYSAALQGARRVIDAQAEWGHGAPWVQNSLGLGPLEDREAAFAAGYAARTLKACLATNPSA